MLFSSVRAALCRRQVVSLGLALLVGLVLQAGQVRAEETVHGNADAHYDRTGDGLVDAEDWARLNEQERTAYARESLLELGLEPEVGVGGERTRLQDYLDGLRAVYGR